MGFSVGQISRSRTHKQKLQSKMICKIAFVLSLIAGNTLAQQDSTAFTHPDPYYDAGFRDGAGSWEASNPAATAEEEIIVTNVYPYPTVPDSTWPTQKQEPGFFDSLFTTNGLLQSILVLLGLTLFADGVQKIWPMIFPDEDADEGTSRMMRQLEDKAVLNLMNSIEDFKAKYLH